MLAIQILALVAFISSASAYDLPLTMTPSATGTQLYARQLFPGQFLPGQLTAGEHTAARVSAGTAQASAGCGLESNVWGQVSPVSASGYANLCLQCRVNVFGVEIFEFNFYNALAASISAHGVSASQISVLQSAIDVSYFFIYLFEDYFRPFDSLYFLYFVSEQGDLLRLSAGSKTSASCTAACAGDQRMLSSLLVLLA
jgi:hypothetical protein